GVVLPVEFFQPWLDELQATQAWNHFVNASADELKSVCSSLKAASLTFQFTNNQRQLLDEFLQKQDNNNLFAVRSSSPEEDLEGTSFAGGYETILGVNTNTLDSAIHQAFASCLDVRVVIYKKEHGFDITNPKLAIVIQQQIASDVAGVGFSLNPVT